MTVFLGLGVRRCRHGGVVLEGGTRDGVTTAPARGGGGRRGKGCGDGVGGGEKKTEQSRISTLLNQLINLIFKKDSPTKKQENGIILLYDAIAMDKSPPTQARQDHLLGSSRTSAQEDIADRELHRQSALQRSHNAACLLACLFAIHTHTHTHNTK